MQSKPKLILILIATLLAFCAASRVSLAQGTAFTYQGQLSSAAGGVSGLYDFQFAIYNSASGGSQVGSTIVTNGVPVTSGLFVVTLDFGAGVFSGSPRWLDLAAGTNGSPSSFVSMTPRQALTATPYSAYAGSAAGVSGISVQQNSSGAPNVIEGSQNNSVSDGFVGATISGGGATNYLGTAYTNSVTGNFSTVSGGAGNTAGSSSTGINGKPFTGNFSVVGGGFGNYAGGESKGYATVGGGSDNAAIADYATVGGGNGNQVNDFGGGDASNGAIGGGTGNQIIADAGSADAAVISGGQGNGIIGEGGHASDSTIGGGQGNTISGRIGNAMVSTIGGGQDNVIDGSSFGNAPYSSIGGGQGNLIKGSFATIPGGQSNLVTGTFSFAAGQQAQATNNGAFVWADSQNASFSSTTTNEFSVRAQNGIRIQSAKGIHLNAADEPIIVRDWNPFATNAPASKAGIGRWGLFMEPTYLTIGIPDTNGIGDTVPRYLQVAKYATNGNYSTLILVDQTGSLFASNNVYAKGVQLTSDRNAKENFKPVDPQAILAKISSIPVTQWNYKDDSPETKHIGPVAQDFHAAFGLDGEDNRHISMIDESGVALAAIQGLNEELKDKDAVLKKQAVEISDLKSRLEALEKIVRLQN